MTDLTDEQEQTAYEIFERVARLDGIESARQILCRVARDFGLPFNNHDLQRWESCYQTEKTEE